MNILTSHFYLTNHFRFLNLVKPRTRVSLLPQKKLPIALALFEFPPAIVVFRTGVGPGFDEPAPIFPHHFVTWRTNHGPRGCVLLETIPSLRGGKDSPGVPISPFAVGLDVCSISCGWWCAKGLFGWFSPWGSLAFTLFWVLLKREHRARCAHNGSRGECLCQKPSTN